MPPKPRIVCRVADGSMTAVAAAVTAPVSEALATDDAAVRTGSAPNVARTVLRLVDLFSPPRRSLRLCVTFPPLDGGGSAPTLGDDYTRAVFDGRCC
jgi:hypothetical protein